MQNSFNQTANGAAHSQPAIKREMEEIGHFLAESRAGYKFTPDYKAAERRLIVLRNPAANYDIARRAAAGRYLSIRNRETTAKYRSWARQTALADLADIKADYAPLIGGAA